MTDYYAHPSVRARIAECLGADSPSGKPTCMSLTVGDEAQLRVLEPRKAGDWSACLEQNLELCRSLWDSASLVADLDIEYVNFDFPAEPYLDPERTFGLQEVARATAQARLAAFGIVPLKVLSGRGHHLIWRVRREATAFERLRALGHPAPSVLAYYERTPSPAGATVEADLAAAYHGLGQVMEYLAAEVKWHAAPRSRIPVELTALEVGPGERGREMISLDLSEYGDPLDARAVRVPFSRYLKVQQQKRLLGERIAGGVPPLSVLVLQDLTVPEALRLRRDPSAVAAFAERVSAAIPDCSEGMERLINSYGISRLAAFHREFYRVEPDPPERWHATYDRTDLARLPPCARLILERPNDLLLRPSGIRRIVAVLLALGWHPRHIAGLIQSKFERTHHAWGQTWAGYDPATRADLYTRVFAGLIAARYDDLVDFNCQSAREQGTCHVPGCRENLAPFKQSLLDRRHHERLARGPVHRLFLPAEHL